MWQQIRNNPRAAILAVLAHIIFIAILVLSFTFSRDVTKSVKGPELEVVKARAVDEQTINAQMKRLRDAETRKQQKIKERVYRQKQARLAEKKAKKKRRQEAIKRKQKKAAEKKRQAQLKIERQRQKRLAEEKKRQQAEQQRIKEKERKRQQALARQEAEMKQKLTAEDRRRQAAARQQANQQAIKKYLGLIKNAVTQHWTLPAQEVKGLHCKVKVRIIPNGEVIYVQIIKSSGNLAFDRSVETAVYRAAPLPVPSIDSGLFDQFREVIFSFEPRDI